MQYDLEVKAVSKRYALHGQTHTAVDQLTLHIPKGAFFSILGPSGCGKTTLLRMIAGFVEPDEGEIWIGGDNMKQVAPNRRPANMVFQHLALFPMMNVGDNVAYGLSRRGTGKAETKRKVDEMLERVGLPGIAAKQVHQLSGGQKQRVAIARSLVLEPTLLLLDEPLGALDLKLREHMKLELKQLQAQIGTTFVYITHDQSEALVMSDTIAVMNRGRFEQCGTPQDLYYRPQTTFVADFVGQNNRLQGVCQLDASGRKLAVLDNGFSLVLQPELPSELPFSAGDNLDMFIRPESIIWSTQVRMRDEQENQFLAFIEDMVFDGANSTVLLKLEDSQILMRASLRPEIMVQDLRKGKQVSVSLPARHLQVFVRQP
ncbi:ABC transporter ATP-binding protein [Undibacterium sp. Ji50W]|uniref:ABC transporter ATP-binding protein n=1 Tax=Undibacterium sp. Ji50W TaxID=3413041 RepID=UPI003BF26332